MKIESRFIEELEQRAGMQKKLMETELIPRWAKRVGDWLAVNPWRVLVPLSAIAYGLLRTAYGENYREFVLGLFGVFK